MDIQAIIRSTQTYYYSSVSFLIDDDQPCRQSLESNQLVAMCNTVLRLGLPAKFQAKMSCGDIRHYKRRWERHVAKVVLTFS